MRYISHAPSEIQDMLKTLGITGVESLFEDIPNNIRLSGEMELPEALSEIELKESSQVWAKRTRLPILSILSEREPMTTMCLQL